MNIIKKFRKLILAFVFIATSFALFGQSVEDVSEAYRQIDEAIVTNAPDKISEVLKKNLNSPNYKLIENYTL